MLRHIIVEMVELHTEIKQCNYKNCKSVAVLFSVCIATIKMFISTTSFFALFCFLRQDFSVQPWLCSGTHSVDQASLKQTLKKHGTADYICVDRSPLLHIFIGFMYKV